MTEDLDLDTLLSAYRDGELPEAEMRVVSERIASEPEVKAAYGALLRADEAVDRAFAELLNAPVPADLVAAVQNVVSAPVAANSPFPPRWGLRIAAALALLAIGAAGGVVGTKRFGTEQVATASWLDQVAEYHRVYSAQERHLVEVSAAETPHLEAWLSGQTGVDFHVPDLSASGLTFQGGRLLVANGRPVAQLMYTDSGGQVIALCFMTGGDAAVGAAHGGFTPRSVDGLDMVSWKTSAASFVLIGPKGLAGLEKLAETAAISL